MPTTRRALLGAVLAAPLAAVAAHALGSAHRHVTARPRGSGTSTQRCAQCGQAGHTMLDRSCPAAPEAISWAS